MQTPTDQERIASVLLRVCTGKDHQAEATWIANKISDDDAKTTISFLEKYAADEFILLTKAISAFSSTGNFDADAVRVLSALVPVMTAFAVEDKEAVSFLHSMTAVATKYGHLRKEEPELLLRGMMVGFIVQNFETQDSDHLRWVGKHADELGVVSSFLMHRRSVDRSTCDLALAGFEATHPLQPGLL